MYRVDVAHQSDVQLTLSHTDSHAISHENSGPVQYLSIIVISMRDGIHPFEIRFVNSTLNDDLTISHSVRFMLTPLPIRENVCNIHRQWDGKQKIKKKR